MKKIFNLSYLILFIFQAQANGTTTDPDFSVKVNQTTVLLGNYFEVTFTLKNAKGQNFEAPNFTDFDLVSGPNQSSSFSMMNGVTTQSLAYTYFLKPKEVGNFYIPPAFIKVDELTLETQPIEIMVMENPDGIIEQPKRQNPNRMELFQFPSDDFFSFPSDGFFSFPKMEIPENSVPRDGEQEGEMPDKKSKKKKRKIYKL